MKTINDIIEEGRKSLPPCDASTSNKVSVITTVMEPNPDKPGMVSNLFVLTFIRVANEDGLYWELADAELKGAAPAYSS